MGRGRGGGRSPTPNDDRSRSMNPQDPVGQAAMANEARQRSDYDDDWDGPEDSLTDFSEIITRQAEKARKPLPTVERLMRPTGEVASIVYSRIDQKYVLTVSDHRNFVMFVTAPDYFEKLLVGLGYTVEIEWRKY